MVAALGAALATLACAGPALADVTLDSFDATPSTTAAGGHPDLTLEASFSYTGDDDLKGLVFHFPPGLLGNPEATSRCTQQQFEADLCPPETRVGSTTVVSQVLGLPGSTSSSGSVYNLVPAGSEPARLGIVVEAGGGLLGKIFLTSPVTLRTATDFGIDSTTDNMPRELNGVPIRVESLSLTLNAQAGAPPQPFMSNPTSCQPAQTVVEAFSYNAPDARASASDAFTPTDCERLRFAPRIEASVGARGATARNAQPPFTAAITQASGESATSAATVTLPSQLGANAQGLANLCTAEQLASNACPAESRVGTGTVVSPLLSDVLTGPAYAVARPGTLPGVSLALSGPLTFTLNGAVTLSPSVQIQNTFAGLPDVPLSRFELKVDGGERGLLTIGQDLCTGTAPVVTGVFSGHSGATANVESRATVVGCEPNAFATARGFRPRGKRPRLAVTARVGRDAPRLRSVRVRLPRDIRVRRRGSLRRGASVRSAAAVPSSQWSLSRRGTLSVTLPGTGASRVGATLSGSLLSPSRKLARRLRRRRAVTLRMNVRVEDVDGGRATLPVRVRVRR